MLNTQRQVITSTAQISDNMSALPDGIIRHSKPLSNHHYILTRGDISPAAQVSNSILRDRITNRDPNKPFVVAALEDHAYISHVMLVTELLARFALHRQESLNDKKRDFIYASEFSHNDLNNYRKIPKKYKYQSNIYDPFNHLLLREFSKNYDYLLAPMTNKSLYQTCLKYGIKTCFSDAAKISDGHYLDSNDPFTKDIAKDIYGVNLDYTLIKCVEKYGISIRNDVMAARGLATAGENSVVIQRLGSNHGGNKANEDRPYEHSYLAACRKRGAEVTSIFLSSAGDNTAEKVIPEQALIDDPNMIIIDGMPKYQGFAFYPLVEYLYLKYMTFRHSNKHLIDPEMEEFDI